MHLYLEIAWWGLLNGSILVFLRVYASRLGASTFQLGLMTATPAILNLLLTFPASGLLAHQPVQSVMRWSVTLTRAFYFLLIPLPALLPPETQVWVILAITILMNIPGTLVAMAYNAFFAESVPYEWRGHVEGVRNAFFSITTMSTALMVGLVLDNLPFQAGYQIIFTVGAVGALMSTVHLWQVRLPGELRPPERHHSDRTKQEVRGDKKPAWRTMRWQAPQWSMLYGAFGRLLVLIFGYQVSLYLIDPVVPKYQVNVLRLSDATISQAGALFWVTRFAGSLQSQKLSKQWGFQRLAGRGLILVTITLVVFTYSFQHEIYLLYSLLSGIGWAWTANGLNNHILGQIPEDDRPSHLAWWNLVNNTAMLASGLLAPLVVGLAGMKATLLLAAAIRLGVGLALCVHGPPRLPRSIAVRN